jgi:hypothetical protein
MCRLSTSEGGLAALAHEPDAPYGSIGVQFIYTFRSVASDHCRQCYVFLPVVKRSAAEAPYGWMRRRLFEKPSLSQTTPLAIASKSP